MIENSAMLTASQRGLRRPNFRVRFAWDRTVDPTIDYLTYDNSENYDSGLVYRYESGDVLQEWDQYSYTDMTSRLLMVNVERELMRPSSVALAFADLTFDNTDGIFNGGGTYGSYMLPSRPVKIDMGFDSLLIPQFVGLTARKPEFDEKNRTVSFYAQDFLGLLLSRPIQETTLIEGARVDQILGVLFEAVGLLPTQYQFDVATVTIPFFNAKKGDTLFNVARDLVDAEVGKLWMDEFGMIRFSNRGNFNETKVFDFNSYDNIFDYTRRREDDLINKIQVTAKVRTLSPRQRYWEQSEPFAVDAGSTKEIWANFDDPVKNVQEPSIGSQWSSYRVNTNQSGDGTSSTDVTVTSFTEFGTSVKIVFSNADTVPLYVHDLCLYCEPARVTEELFVEEFDQTSVDSYGERILTIENDYFASESDAQSYATRILVEYKEPALVAELDVLGTPQFQLDDIVDVHMFGVTNRQQIVRIANKIEGTTYTQTLRLKDYPDLPFFSYDNSQNYDAGNIYRI